MKTKKLYLLRHAKSSWKDFAIKDFDRPLNKRGKTDAPMMAKLIAEMGVSPDIILSSPAKRAKCTAEYFSKALDKKIEFDDSIYEASPSQLLALVKEVFKHHKEVMVVGHNPSFTALSNMLLSDQKIENIPTAGIVALAFKDGHIENDTAQLLFFEYPKKQI